MPKLPVYFDCDTGIDDALALAQLVALPQVDLVGVSTVSGNTTAAQAAGNTLDLLAMLGRDDVPVAVGAHDPLVGSYLGGAAEVHGANGVGDIKLPRSSRATSPVSGVEQLIDAARQHPGELRLVAVGPLTNLALALREAPELPDLIGHLTVMGGAVWVPGNVTPQAEANIYNDPEAAAIVLSAGWPVTLVPLDVTMTHTFDDTVREALAAHGPHFHAALAGMLDTYLRFHQNFYGERVSALHDPMATMLATGDVLASEIRTTAIAVDTTAEESRGRTVAVQAGPGLPDIDVVTAVETPVGPLLLERILSLKA